MTVRLVAISTYDSLARLVAFIALNLLVLCAFKVKEDPFLHTIVLVDPFVSFSFQRPGCFFLFGGFHVTHVIFRHKNFASVAIYVTTHMHLSRYVLFTVVEHRRQR